jgi:hypothetical protein
VDGRVISEASKHHTLKLRRRSQARVGQLRICARESRRDHQCGPNHRA